MTEDAELLRRYAEEKSEPAFAELVRRHLNFVYSTAYRRVGCDSSAASDVTQSVFLALARRATALAERPVLAGWLYTCAKNAATDYVRADARRQRFELQAHLMNEQHSSPEAPLEWEQLGPLLESALDALNDRDREAILLRYFENRSYVEIGTQCAIAADTARMRVDRALDKLRQRLARAGITSTSAALAATLAGQAVSAAPPHLGAAITLQAFSSGAASSPAALLINLMFSTKIVVSAGALIAAFAVGLATVEVSAWHRANTAAAAAQQNLANLANEVQTLERAAARAKPTAILTPPPVHAAPVAANQRQPPRFAQRDANGKALLAAHPELTELLKSFFQAGIDNRYAPIFLALNLSPDQIAGFERVMAPNGYFAWDTPSNSVLFSDPNPALSAAEKEQQLQAILGVSGYQQFQQLKDSMGPSAVQQIAGAASAMSASLTPAQIATLSTILAPLTETNSSSFDWSTVQTQAGAVLNEDQLKVVDAFQQQFRFNLALHQAIARAGLTP